VLRYCLIGYGADGTDGLDCDGDSVGDHVILVLTAGFESVFDENDIPSQELQDAVKSHSISNSTEK